MRRLLYIFVLILINITAVLGQQIAIEGPDRTTLIEGEKYTIAWAADDVESVSIVVHGTNTLLGTISRGNFRIELAEAVPAEQGSVQWIVPWIDSLILFIKVKGYDSTGRQVAITERGYRFRSAVMANRTEDGIYLDLHERRNQRLYVQKDQRITHAYLSSSSESYIWMPSNRHVTKPHDHAGVFEVLQKKRLHWSSLFEVEMPWAMRYHAGHYIHATSSNLYGLLGQPASHGCNRLTYHDARELYQMTPIGTRVEVIGPSG